MERLGNLDAKRPLATRAGQDHISAPGVPVARHATFAVADRISWRWVGTGVASAGMPVVVGVLRPVLGVVVVFVAISVVLTILGTAMFGTPELSSRAFRLMRWIRNQPEPTTPHAELADGQPVPNPAAPPASALASTCPPCSRSGADDCACRLLVDDGAESQLERRRTGRLPGPPRDEPVRPDQHRAVRADAGRLRPARVRHQPDSYVDAHRARHLLGLERQGFIERRSARRVRRRGVARHRERDHHRHVQREDHQHHGHQGQRGAPGVVADEGEADHPGRDDVGQQRPPEG